MNVDTPHGIGWDLDHTLVGYPPKAPTYGDAMQPVPRLAIANDMLPRPGIELALRRLSAHGYRHFVTTGGTREYAERVLRATGLRAHISGIFEGAEIDARSAKRYRPLAQALGLSDEEAPQRLLVIGDLIYDQSADLDGVVFIHQPNGYRHDAAQIEAVIALLEETGSGNLNAGFHALYRALELADPRSPTLMSTYASRLPEGVAVSFELRDPHRERPVPGLARIIIPRVLLLAGQ